MSIALMTLAWQTALPLNQKAALLALADWANDDGASLHPSIYALAERLTCSERTVQRLMRDLEVDQWIAVVGNFNGGLRGTTRRYRINVRKLRAVADAEEVRRKEARRAYLNGSDEFEVDPFAEDVLQDTGDKLSGVTNQVGTGDKSSETGDKSGRGGVTNQVVPNTSFVTLTTNEPSVEPLNTKTARRRAPMHSGAPAKPDGVMDQTWADWLQLRKIKRAPVTATVLDGATDEAAKAGLSLEAFLKIWCVRGSQGLQADWLKPAELQQYRGIAPQETPYQRQMREKMEILAPRFAASAPASQPAADFFRQQAIDVQAREVDGRNLGLDR